MTRVGRSGLEVAYGRAIGSSLSSSRPRSAGSRGATSLLQQRASVGKRGPSTSPGTTAQTEKPRYCLRLSLCGWCARLRCSCAGQRRRRVLRKPAVSVSECLSAVGMQGCGDAAPANIGVVLSEILLFLSPSVSLRLIRKVAAKPRRSTMTAKSRTTCDFCLRLSPCPWVGR